MAVSIENKLPSALLGTTGSTNIARLQSSIVDEPDITWATAAFPQSGVDNQVMTLGHNRAGSGGKQDSSKHSWHIGMEREFDDGSHRQTEYYVQYVSADDSITIRPINADVNTDDHESHVSFQADTIDALNSAVDYQWLTTNSQGQMTLLSDAATGFIGVDHNGTGLPSSGTFRMTDNCNIVGRRGGVDVVFTQLTASPNMIIGSAGNACGMFVDAGPGQAVNIRANAGSVTLSLSSTRLDIPVPARLPTYSVATLPTGAEREVAYCSDGASGSPCLAVHDGTAWKQVALGATVTAS